MYKLLFPTRDTSIYQRHPDRNTGLDQILELTKITSGSAIEDMVGQSEYWGETLNSRFLLDFDLSAVSASIVSGEITNPQFYLKLNATDAVALPMSYTLMAHPISGSWTNGTGYYNNDFEVTNGASWNYRYSLHDSTPWTQLGGDFYTGSLQSASQSFNYTSPDVHMDVTNIVRQWLSGSIPQNGMIVKHTDTAETGSEVLGSLKFFSKDTHTIWIPRLEVFWNNVDVTGTGSITEVSSDDYSVYIKNLKDSYKEGEVAKLRVGVRPTFPTPTYTTTNAYLTSWRLPTTSYFKVTDVVTDEELIPFHADATRVDCDTNGNYVVLPMDTFLPLRYYKIVFKVVDGSEVKYIDDNYTFKVER